MNVQFVDLQPQYKEVKAETDAAIQKVVADSSFIQGKPVKEFEQALAKSFGVRHACGVANGTLAISAVLMGLKVGAEDEVITTVHTAIPTVEAVVLAGAKVVFCDIEENSYGINPSAIEAAITPRTKALLPVHLYGIPAKLSQIKPIAEKRSLALVEDCAQAQGALYEGRPVGSIGVAGCLSFFPSKNLGCWGDGGAVVTNDANIDKFVRMYSNHGRSDKYLHEFLGTNGRLDSLQAVILNEKLKRLETWNEMRRKVAGWYEELLGGVKEVVLPRATPGSTPAWHVYVVLVENRDPFMEFLAKRGIATGLHYPVPLHLQPAFAYLGHRKGDFPVAEKVTSQCVSLPMYPHLSRESVEYVCEGIRAYFGK